MVIQVLWMRGLQSVMLRQSWLHPLILYRRLWVRSKVPLNMTLTLLNQDQWCGLWATRLIGDRNIYLLDESSVETCLNPHRRSYIDIEIENTSANHNEDDGYWFESIPSAKQGTPSMLESISNAWLTRLLRMRQIMEACEAGTVSRCASIEQFTQKRRKWYPLLQSEMTEGARTSSCQMGADGC